MSREIDYTLKNYVDAGQLPAARGENRGGKPSIIESLMEDSNHAGPRQETMETQPPEVEVPMSNLIPQSMLRLALQPPPAVPRKPVPVE
jgi:hypothetical protein